MSITFSSGDEIWVGAEWLFQTLNGDVGPGGLRFPSGPLVTGVFSDLAPPNTPYPFITYGLQAGMDVLGVGADLIWTDCIYRVEVITDNWGLGSAHAAQKRMHSLLHKRSGSVSDGVIHDCVRESPLSRVDEVEGVTHRYLGGLYRLHIQSS